MEQEYFPTHPGAVIKSIRKERGLTQAELCGEQIARNMLSQIETGRVNPSLRTMEFLAERLNVPLSLFFLSEKERGILLEHERQESMEHAMRKGDASLCLTLCEGIEEPSLRVRHLCTEATYRLGYEAFASRRLDVACILLRAVQQEVEIAPRLAACADELLVRIQALFCGSAGQVLYYGDPADEGQSRTLLSFAQSCVQNGTLAGIAEALLPIEFDDKNAKYVALSLLYDAQGRSVECRNAQINIRDKDLCPDTALWYYRKSEECSAKMNDYESAYKLSKKRAQLIEQLQRSASKIEKKEAT